MAYTTIDDPSKFFQTALYTGTGSTRNVTNDGNSDLQPDWVWIKSRNTTSNHNLFDSTRGVTKRLRSNDTDNEDTLDAFSHFLSDGFTITGSPLNDGSATWVAWQWKANGGTTTTNDSSSTGVGNQDSVHQANTTSGFSIVTYTGDSSVGTMAHGLGAVPHVMIVKCRSDDGERWETYHHENTAAPETDHLELSATDATVDSAHTWDDTAPTSTIFTVGNSGATNEDSKTYVAYLFTEIQGYSKFGSYTGNANASGPFIYTGFKPAWLLLKRTDSAGNWVLIDNKRDDFNLAGLDLNSDSNAVENSSTTYYGVDLLSNGFKLRNANGETNGSSTTHVYMAFAESPFVSSEGVPTTAR